MNSMIKERKTTGVDYTFTREFLDPSILTEHVRFQRPLRRMVVKRISQDWRNELCVPLSVNRRRNGEYVVIDGQHRLAAALMAKIAEVECRVFHLEHYKDEALLFRDLNLGSIRITPGEMWRADLEGGEENALAVETLLAKYGFELNVFARRTPTVFVAVRAINSLYREPATLEHGEGEPRPERLEAALWVLAQLWKDDIRRVDGDIITGISHFQMLYPEADLLRMVEVLRDNATPGSIITVSRVSDMGQHTRRSSVSRVIWSHYNKGLGPKNRLENRYTSNLQRQE